MFKDDIRLYGKHAKILKKYSRDNSSNSEYKFDLRDHRNKIMTCYIFETMIGLFMCSAMVGIIEGKKAPVDNNKDVYANIMSQQVVKYRSNLERIYKFMILSNKDESVDKRIKTAFTVKEDNNHEMEKEIYAYARGGLEIIDSYFKECKTYEDVANALSIFVQDYSVEID